jgi:phage tail sheath gpL-like
MSIAFNQVPTALRIPWVGVEFDSSRAAQGPALLRFRGLIIGQKLAAGTGAVNTLILVSSADQVGQLAGRGSIAHEQAKAWFGATDTPPETWLLLVADAGGGTAATWTITVTAAPTESAALPLYAGGDRMPVGITAGMTVNAVAAAIEAEFDAHPDYAVTASVSGAVVTVLFRHAGEVGNDFDLRAAYQAGERLPAGLALTITQTVVGATNPTLATAIAALGDEWFHVWAHPYTDATSLTAIETELLSRAGAMRGIDGFSITAADGTLSGLVAIGTARNSPYNSILAADGENPITPPWRRAAAAAAQVAVAAQNHPARPFQTLQLNGCLPTAVGDRFTDTERNTLLFNGIATTVAAAGGVVRLNRLISTYRKNAAGADDTAYLDATTAFSLMFLRYTFKQRIANKYPRHLLGNDGGNYGAGLPIMTPSVGRAEALSWFLEMESLGVVEGYAQFERDLVVERNAQDPNRLDWLLSPDLMNQLIVAAAKMSFLL